MLKSIKRTVLHVMRGTGALRLIAGSGWRKRRLLILCYHGVSLDDEHLWNPRLYVNPETFRQRLELLRSGGFTVLPLDDAIQRLSQGTLPDRAVTITFDDGHYDFYPVAWPILREYGFPATVYLTTYHCDCNVPIFALVCSYMLWKSRVEEIDLSGVTGGGRAVIDSRAARSRVLDSLVSHVATTGLSALEKHEVARKLARQLEIDFDALCARRTLHLLDPAEVAELAADGVDFQLHTHCHRSPRAENAYRDQIRRNRIRIEELAGRQPIHFCYPGGETAPEFPPWLRAEGVESAVTCRPGLAVRSSDPLMLPRLLDHSGLSGLEFEGWISGFSSLLPGVPTAVGTRASTLPSARSPVRPTPSRS